MADTIQEQIRAAIDSSASVLITSAAKPDGDSVAAQLALRRMILMYKPATRVDIINEVLCPPRYRFLPGADAMRTIDDPDLLERYDAAITVDCSPERSGRVRPLHDLAKVRINIDHHIVRTEAGADINLVWPHAGSTAEMIVDFLDNPAWKAPVDPVFAEILYTGMIFDSGGFVYKLTTPHTLRTAARLLETGFDFARVAERVLLVRSVPARLLLGRVISGMTLHADGAIASAVVTLAMMGEVGASTDDLEGLVEQVIFTEGLEVAVLAIELPAANEYKFSLRSRGRVNVAALARTLEPQGGGHDRAAGCTLSGSADEVVSRVVRAVAERLEANRESA
jgi:bifunctional oligoribonuclease and PAP phosphatase NrnA